ncbi:MAG: group 1 truncated hemoglobin [Calditrichota bacterium]
MRYIIIGLLTITSLFSCIEEKSTAEVPGEVTLYERLGGLPAITAVVDTFTAKVAANQQLLPFFANSDLTRFKRLLVEMICEAANGPCSYSGRTMTEIHEGMGVSNADFDAMVGELQVTLNEFSVPAEEQQELMIIMGLRRADIVENP